MQVYCKFTEKLSLFNDFSVLRIYSKVNLFIIQERSRTIGVQLPINVLISLLTFTFRLLFTWKNCSFVYRTLLLKIPLLFWKTFSCLLRLSRSWTPPTLQPFIWKVFWISKTSAAFRWIWALRSLIGSFPLLDLGNCSILLFVRIPFGRRMLSGYMH